MQEYRCLPEGEGELLKGASVLQSDGVLPPIILHMIYKSTTMMIYAFFMNCDQTCDSYYVKDVSMMTNICKAALVLFGDANQTSSDLNLHSQNFSFLMDIIKNAALVPIMKHALNIASQLSLSSK